MGRKFFIQTDQCSLKYLLEQRITIEQQKWVSKLFGYEYEIIYKHGKENLAADALSHMAGSPCLDVLFVSQAQVWDNIKEEAVSHPYMQKIGKLATENPGSPYTGKMDWFVTRTEWWYLLNPTSFSSYCENSMTRNLVAIQGCY